MDTTPTHKKRRRGLGKIEESPLKFRILTVGDGDLTLSLSLARAYSNQVDLVASTLLSSPQELTKTYSNSEGVLQELNERGIPVKFSVDATNLNKSFNDDKFGAILFHHPHLGSLEDEQVRAQRHYILLAHYFHSAKQHLTDDGIVHVCLCGNQPTTWNVVQAAQRQQLALFNQVPTTLPLNKWLSPLLGEAAPAQPNYPAPRRYRNGKLGSKHFLAKYGYRHRRTHGELQSSGNNTTTDVNVSGSIHFIFGNNGTECKRSNGEVVVSENECKVCGMTFDSADALEQHCKAPALPDPVETSSVVCCDSNSSNVSIGVVSEDMQVKEVNGSTATITRPPRQEPNISEHDDQRDAVFTSIVKPDHDGKRLKWFLRHWYGTSAGISKQQTESMIKNGRVLVNATMVVDSGRFLHAGDSIRVVKETANNTVGAMTQAKATVEICHESHYIVVAFKPVGMRTIGSFSDQTLEMVVSSQLHGSFKAISKLDTGCAGLCALQRDKDMSNNAQVREVSHVFTALVHGNVPASWNGQTFQLAVNSMRRWKNSGDNKNNEYMDTNDSNDNEESDEATIHVLETTTSSASNNDDDTTIPALSTITITTSSTSSGLCNAICFALRKRGHPVVNDRFCRREYLTLPRSIRNLIKNRLCIGCFQINMTVGEQERVETVSVDVTDRLHALHWQTHCQSR